jgi:hypothetical protein
MQYLIRATAIVLVAALFAIHSATVHAAPKEGDWKGGWNTWKTAKEGDWIEYTIGGFAGVRQEVTKVSGDKVTYSHKTLDKDGNETSVKEYTKAWNAIKLQGRLPYGKEDEVEWTEEEVELGGKTLKCDVASWTAGSGKETARGQIFFCKDVPCGGIVKTVTNGKDSVWIKSFGKAGEEAANNGEEKDPEPEIESKLPRFYAAVGNKAVIKISAPGRDDSWQLRTIVKVEETVTTWSVVACDKDGNPDGRATPRELEQTKKDWDATYGSPREKDVKLKVEAGELVCEVHVQTEGDKETTDWISEGLPVKRVIKVKGRDTTLELVSFTMK